MVVGKRAAVNVVNLLLIFIFKLGQGAVYKFKCSDYQASYIGETIGNLNTRLTEHKRATRNGDALHHQLMRTVRDA